MRKRAIVGGLALGVFAALWPRRVRAKRPTRPATFDPATVARLEVAGWRAYYARNPLAALLVLGRLVRGQFALPPGAALRAMYRALRAQAAFAGKRGRPGPARAWLERFYALTPRRDGVTPSALADAEVEYWVQHRRVVGQADQEPLVAALARLHALLFGGAAADMRPSAEARAAACQAVDRITGRVSADPARDWTLAEAQLRRAYELAVAVGTERAREAEAAVA